MYFSATILLCIGIDEGEQKSLGEDEGPEDKTCSNLFER